MIIITGGTGFIGSNLLAALSDRGERVVVADWLGDQQKWKNIAKHKVADLIDPENLLPSLDRFGSSVKALFHMGAISTTTERNVDLILETNFRLSCKLYMWCAKHQVQFIYASSAATYGDGTLGFHDDETFSALCRLRPLNPYGWSKNLFDQWVARQNQFNQEKPSQTVGLKFFNVFGPNEYHKGPQRSVAEQIYPYAMRDEAFPLFKSLNPHYEDGGQLRDFIWVQDVIDVLLWFYDHPKNNGLFNCGTGKARSFGDLLTAVYQAAGKEPKVIYKDMPPELKGCYQYHTEAIMEKLRNVGYTQPFTSLEDGVALYVRNYLSQTDPYR